ncbi:MAG: YkgJ family cysteine cluster protein [Planctomycetaceae bacterium]
MTDDVELPIPADADSSPATVPEPWYRDGLQFTCSQCGDCCTGAPGVVWVTDEELREIADYLDKPTGEIRLFHTRIVRGRVSLTEFQNGDCTFFDPASRHCRVYPVRPTQCRTWPFWKSNIATEETWKRTCEYCPGSGTGAFFSLEEVEARAAQVQI